MTPVAQQKKDLIQSCLRLPVKIDTQRLLAEIKTIPGELWVGDRGIVHKEVTNVFLKGYPPNSQIADDDERPAIKFTPYLRSIIYDMIPGIPAKALIATLKVNGVIPAHKDAGIPLEHPSSIYFRNTFRIHVAIKTNDKALFYCNGEFFQMAAGEMWAINNLTNHGVINQGDEERIHLIFDIHPTEQTESFFSHCTRIPGIQRPDLVSLLMKNPQLPDGH